MKQTDNRFRRIIEAARSRDGMSGTDTMLVSSHLSQMRMFMLRQGVEFYPRQDTYGMRKKFILALITENEVDARLEGIVDDFLCDGKGLFLFRPVKDSYRIMWFPQSRYRAYYGSDGQVETVDVIYSFQVRQTVLGASSVIGPNDDQWVRLQIRRDQITESITREKPSFDDQMSGVMGAAVSTRTTVNSLGFIPAVEAFNNMRSTGMESTGDFDWLAEHILVHDDLVKDIRQNLKYFGTPTLVSSRPKHDLTESDDPDASPRPTIASQAGFVHQNRAASASPGVRVPRMISNIEPTDRVAYITPDAISGDQNTYARQYREEIRTALGGVDELGISTGATAYEIRSLYGRAATTALRKCRGLLEYGLCKLIALMIYHEERIFEQSFAVAVGLPEPVVMMREDFENVDLYNTAVEMHGEEYAEWRQELTGRIQQAIDQADIPPGVVGLIPDGDRKIEWRWTGPVFEDSTQDILNNSIVVRNLQELGVNSIEALRYLFPDKTDEERSAMLNGYPFRMAQATQQSIQAFMQLIAQMGEIPHPQSPDLPLLADAQLDLTPYLYRALDYLKRELTYAGSHSDSNGSFDPAELTPIQRARIDAGLPVNLDATRQRFVPDSRGIAAAAGGAAAADGGGQSMGVGVQQARRGYERDEGLPLPGSTMAYDPAADQLSAGLDLSATTERLPGIGAFSGGAGDLDAARDAGLLGAPDTDTDDQPAKPRSRRVSRQRQRRQS